MKPSVTARNIESQCEKGTGPLSMGRVLCPFRTDSDTSPPHQPGSRMLRRKRRPWLARRAVHCKRAPRRVLLLWGWGRHLRGRLAQGERFKGPRDKERRMLAITTEIHHR